MTAAQPPVLLMVLNDAPFFLSHRLAVARAAREAGFSVHVAVRYDQEAVAVIRAEGFTYHDIPLARGSRRIAGELRLIAALWRLVRAVRPDILHAVTMKPVIYGGMVARLCRVPAVVHAVTGLGYLFLIEGTAARVQRALLMALYRFALAHRNCRAIFQNPDDLGLFHDRGLVERGKETMIKGCGVDIRRFAELPEPSGPPVVMFPARILGDKGVHEFVFAARTLKHDGIAARFVMVGRTDPDNPTDVGEATIRAWEREGLVEWWGFSRDMAASLAQATVVCMPSYREGLPRVLIEAGAIGRAVVTTNVPGCREIVHDGDTGLLVPVRDGNATAAAIRQLLDDPERRRAMARRARARVAAKFSEEVFVARSLDVYRQVLAGTRSD